MLEGWRTLALAAMALGLLAGCDASAGSEGVAADSAGKALSEQVFGTWSCTAPGRPAWSFTVSPLGPGTTRHAWSDGLGGEATAYVHVGGLYLEDGREQPYRNFLYTADAAQTTLVALDQFPGMEAPLADYHCVK